MYCREPRKYQTPAERPGTDLSPAPAEGAWTCRHLDLGLVASRTMRQGIHVVKPLLLWHFVQVAFAAHVVRLLWFFCLVLSPIRVRPGWAVGTSELPSQPGGRFTVPPSEPPCLMYGVKLIPSALPISVDTCTAPSTLVLAVFSNYHFPCHNRFCKYSLVGVVRIL